jgi:gas vesicle protein
MNDQRNGSGVGVAALAFVIGAAAGVATGVLISPKSGKENRGRIKKAANDTKVNLQDHINHSKDAIVGKLNTTVDTAKTAIEEGKKTYRESNRKNKET